MIKECKVISTNKKVSIAVFDGNKIQIPSRNIDNNVAYIKFENGRYYVSNRDDFEKTNIRKKQSKKEKRETNERAVSLDKVIVIDNVE